MFYFKANNLRLVIYLDRRGQQRDNQDNSANKQIMSSASQYFGLLSWHWLYHILKFLEHFLLEHKRAAAFLDNIF